MKKCIKHRRIPQLFLLTPNNTAKEQLQTVDGEPLLHFYRGSSIEGAKCL